MDKQILGDSHRPPSPSSAFLQSAIVVRNDLAQVDRLWVRNLCPAEDDEAADGVADGREVLSPKLDSTAPCQACGRHFAPEDNEWDSCR